MFPAHKPTDFPVMSYSLLATYRAYFIEVQEQTASRMKDLSSGDGPEMRVIDFDKEMLKGKAV